MIYLFRKYNGQIAITSGAAAWEMYTSDGQWKHQPQYLGAIDDQQYRELKAKVQEEVPISDELIAQVNTGDKSKDRELRQLHNRRSKLHGELLEELAASADRSVTPPNMNIINKDQLPKEYHKAAEGLASHE